MGDLGPLILGSTGLVGRALAHVWPVARPALWQHRPFADPVPGRALCWDILNTPAPDPLPDFNGVVLLAMPRDKASPALAVDLARRAADLAATAGQRLILTSSQAIYGPQTTPAHEDDPVAPTSPYGQMKQAVEQAVADAPHVTCVRIGNVLSADMLLLQAARGPVDLTVWPDGSGPRRFYIGPVTLAHALLALLDHPGPLPSVMNLAQPGAVAMTDLLAAAGLSYTPVPAQAHHLPSLPLDLTRMQDVLDLPAADPASLIAEARAAGWRPAP